MKIDGSPPEYSNKNIQFHFNNDPNFTVRKDAFLKAKQEEVSKKYEQDGNITNPDLLLMPPVEATASEVYQSLYGNPGNINKVTSFIII